LCGAFEDCRRLSVVFLRSFESRSHPSSILIMVDHRISEPYAFVSSLNLRVQLGQSGVISLFVLCYGKFRGADILIVYSNRTFHISIIAFPKRIQLGSRIQIAWLGEDAFSCTKESASFR